PGEFAPINSIEMIIWVAVGGRGTLFGAVIGAVLVNYAKTYFTGAFAELWLFMLGGLFVLTTLYLPKGVVGLWAQMKDKFMSSGGGGNSGITTGSSSEKSSDQKNSKEAEGNA
ncbi:MAG: urea ABC transporter permease subunit UrtC, partial [Pseudomonadota bacterium]|nr:urea ABC transporter permease subunit UrtC [Pseudomonadota bacterium]